MSQKMPKLPQLNPTVHGTGYLEENYGKKKFRIFRDTARNVYF